MDTGPALTGSRLVPPLQEPFPLLSADAALMRQRLIHAEQVRTVYRNLPGGLAGAVIVASLVAAMLIGKIPGRILEGWLLAVVAFSGARLWLWRKFNQASPDAAGMVVWERLLVWGAGAAGLIWGIGGVVLHISGDLAYQLFVLMAVAGIVLTSMYTHAPLLPAFLAYAYPVLLLSAAPFLLEGGPLHLTIGVLTLLLLPFLAQLAAQVSRSFADTTRLQLQNAELVEELRQQKHAAEQAHLAQSRFLAVASHDLRQPLHALGLFVQALQDSPVAAQERQLVGNIRQSVDAMEELFEALLDISRLDAGVVRPRIATFGLASVFDRLESEYGPVAREKGLSLRVRRTSAYVCSDPTLLERIVRNLLSNAVRYTDRGSLLLGCRREADRLRIEVWDTGRGIPADKHREIFKEFAQLDCLERERIKGLGLGLAIVERLARLMEHPVRLRSTEGRGSVFAVSVPRGREEDFIANPSVELTTAFDLNGMLFLIIDAEPAAGEAMEALLTRWNGTVLKLRSDTELRERLAAVDRKPDLIIAEYRSEHLTPLRTSDPPLPRATAAAGRIALIEMLRTEFNAEIPALLLTSGNGPDGVIDPPVAGLAVLHKPLNPARLRTLIANMLRLGELQERPRRAI